MPSTRARSRWTWMALTGALILTLPLATPPVFAQDDPPAEAAPDAAPEQAAPDAATPEAAPEEAPAPRKKTDLDALKDTNAEIASTNLERAQSVLGLVLLLSTCFVLGVTFRRQYGQPWLAATREHARLISWRLVFWGIALQLGLGYLVLKTNAGRAFFSAVNDAFVAITGYTTEGASFLFGNLAKVNNVPVGAGGPFSGGVEGSGQVAAVGAYFAFNVLPTIIFFSSLMALLYHLGVMQAIVRGFAWVMRRTMGTSGSETLSASGNIFVGQTEAPLLVRPFVKGMTRSELMAIMTGGFATVAGGVMAAYVGFLRPYFANIAGHLLSASVMSAPAALVCAKLMIPEPDPTKSETYGDVTVDLTSRDANLVDAAARGAGDGLKLALNVGAMLLAFVALIAMLNGIVGWAGRSSADLIYGPSWSERVADTQARYTELTAQAQPDPEALDAVLFEFRSLAEEAVAVDLGVEDPWVVFDPSRETAYPESESRIVYGPAALDPARPHLLGLDSPGGDAPGSVELAMRDLSIERILGWALAPVAWVMGVPWEDADEVGGLIGKKTVTNEFLAYLDLQAQLSDDRLQHPRSLLIAIYALCGFANFSSIAIQIGGIGGIAPTRRRDLAKLGLKAMIAGTVACLLTATVAGLLL